MKCLIWFREPVTSSAESQDSPRAAGVMFGVVSGVMFGVVSGVMFGVVFAGQWDHAPG